LLATYESELSVRFAAAPPKKLREDIAETLAVGTRTCVQFVKAEKGRAAVFPEKTAFFTRFPMSQRPCHEIPGVQEKIRPNACSPMGLNRPTAPTEEELQRLERGRESLAPTDTPHETRAAAKESRPRLQEEIRAHLRKRMPKQPSQQRPPSATAVQIYERAVIQEVPQRQVAAEFGITQGVVSRKCARVIAWMSRCGVKELRGMTDPERGRYLVRFAEQKKDREDPKNHPPAVGQTELPPRGPTGGGEPGAARLGLHPQPANCPRARPG